MDLNCGNRICSLDPLPGYLDLTGGRLWVFLALLAAVAVALVTAAWTRWGRR
jgi:hypothetical protein